MSDPELGFVEGGYDSPTHASIDRPFLNARQKYTHIVEDGLTQVTDGRIKCALDGGTFQIAMYDVSDEIVGAPRVFTEEITLPERPLEGEDGYEVDTHTFDIDSVELTDYVGRELAVAVRHDRGRLRSSDWSTGFPDEYGWGCASGDREGPLGETWQHELADSMSAISAALFVEPVELPEGKDGTVIDAAHDRRSETVFEAFPDISPEAGLVVEYDEQAESGAPVTVLDNGVVEVGQGSSETDSLDVRVRDSEGTWHGPETVTLTETSGSVAVTASSDTISAGGQATVSLTVESADTVMIEDLWTDWTVTVADPAGAASVQNSVSETGTLTLAWDTVQDTAAPSITIVPPEETYVGGTYAIDVLAESGGDSATATALLDIESGAAGQTATSDQQRTATGDNTTLVASRGPDGSRLTSRPDGPVYHTTDDTIHLFTWDEPAPDARAVLYDEDEGTDWGEGPDIHLYDTMERPDATAGEFPSHQATRGTWNEYSGFPELRPDGHSGEFAARVHEGNNSYKFSTIYPETRELYLSYCVKIPDGKKMPGAEAPGEFPVSASWKMSWIMHEDTGEDVDICLPTWTPSLAISGDGLEQGGWLDGNPSEWWLFGEWMRISVWLQTGPDPSSDPGRARVTAVSEGDGQRVLLDTEVPLMNDAPQPHWWRKLNIPGWAQNKEVSGEDVEVLYDDIYLATGDDSSARARLELSDSTDYEASTRIQLCDVRSWSSNRVSARLRKGSLDSVESAAVHLTTADEQQVVSMEMN